MYYMIIITLVSTISIKSSKPALPTPMPLDVSIMEIIKFCLSVNSGGLLGI